MVAVLDAPRESVALMVTVKVCERMPCRRSVVTEAALAEIVPLMRPFEADSPAGRPETEIVTLSPSGSDAPKVAETACSSWLDWLLALMVGAWLVGAGAGAGAGLPACVPPVEPPVFPPAGAGAGTFPPAGTVPPVVPPPATVPPDGDPPGTEPPDAEPPGTEPPGTEPPGAEPPGS